MNDTSDILRRRTFVLFEPEPAVVQHAYQTIVEPVDAVNSDETTVEDQARALLSYLEVAVTNDRLGLHERRNLLTGARSLIIAEGWEPRDVEVTNVVAELLAEWPHELNDFAKHRFDWFSWSALHQELSIVVHANGPGGSRVAFAAVARKTNDTFHFEYLARLFLAESETAQWSEAR